MKQCKCGSFAINDDKTGEMCDKCLRDNKIKQLEKERDELKCALSTANVLHKIDIDRVRCEYAHELVKWVKGHYWDSLEKDKDMILRHLRTFVGDEAIQAPQKAVQ